VVGAIPIFHLVDIGNRISDLQKHFPDVSASIGAGVWVLIVGAILAVSGGIVAATVKRQVRKAPA
jgi:TRAP-type mannitol/chloroaromatic compound transport system permease large subunit